MTTTRCCKECGKPLSATASDRAEFDTTACRMAWNNRRGARGAELYDLFMAYCYERKLARTLGLFSLMWRMAAVWKNEDGKRKSYMDAETSKARLEKYLSKPVRPRAKTRVGGRFAPTDYTAPL